MTGPVAEIARELVRFAREGKTVTYTDLGRLIGVDPAELAPLLRAVSERCMEMGLPPLSAVVVNALSGMPGSGFFKMVGFHPTGSVPLEEERRTAWEALCRACFACSAWERLWEGAVEATPRVTPEGPHPD